MFLDVIGRVLTRLPGEDEMKVEVKRLSPEHVVATTPRFDCGGLD